MLVAVPGKDEILEQIKTGRYTFLVDKDGNFISEHMELDDAPPDSQQ
jgi:hypothetical protein